MSGQKDNWLRIYTDKRGLEVWTAKYKMNSLKLIVMLTVFAAV